MHILGSVPCGASDLQKGHGRRLKSWATDLQSGVGANRDAGRRRICKVVGVVGRAVELRVPRDNQVETAASIRMRMRRCWTDEARA